MIEGPRFVYKGIARDELVPVKDVEPGTLVDVCMRGSEGGRRPFPATVLGFIETPKEPNNPVVRLAMGRSELCCGGGTLVRPKPREPRLNPYKDIPW